MKFATVISTVLSAVMFCVFSSIAFAESKGLPAKRAPQSEDENKGTEVDSHSALRVSFEIPTWNTDPNKIDSGSLLMREGTTGRTVQIHLVETGPNTSVFAGLYSINWESVETLRVEFYVPPQNLMETAEGMKKVAALIASGDIKRKPFILRRTHSRQQTVEIFESREAAIAALKAYRAQQQLEGLEGQKFPSDNQVEAARVTADLKAKEEAARLNAERAALDAAEAARLTAMKQQEAARSAAEKAKRKKEAERLAAEAMAFYRDNKFSDASNSFSKAIDMDPENRGYYFQYGVTLFKIDNFKKAITYLKIAEGAQVNTLERDFFLGLSYFQLKEYPEAISAFDPIIASKDKTLAPSSLFYKGICLFEQKKWEPSQASFQAVLDTSSDPQLDSRAEIYLEQILRVQQFEQERSHKFQISATLGEQYDSNVNTISDSSLSQGAQTGVDGYRTLVMGSFRYRPVYDEKHEFSVQADVMDMYTVDSNQNFRATLRNADPLVLGLTAPWTYKGLMWGKGYKLDITPGYQTITMSAVNNSQAEIINSFTLNFANLFVMSDTLFSNFNLETSKDTNEIAALSGDNDSSAYKFKLVNSNLHFMNQAKNKIMTTEGAVTMNSATGKNSTYNRADLALGWIQPIFWSSTGTAKLAYYWLNYPQNSNGRIDNDYTLTLGGSKKLSELLSGGLAATYAINSSTVDANTYKKWTLMLTLSALKAF